MAAQTTPDSFNALIQSQSPFGAWLGLKIEAIGKGTARLRLPYRRDFLRPGGVINGPVIMAAADFAMYAAIMGLDPRGEHAVTTNMHTYFLRRTSERDLIAEASVIKAGRRLVVMEASVRADSEVELVAHMTGTYAFSDKGAALAVDSR